MVQLGFDKTARGPAPSLQREIGAYEALWLERKASFKRIAERAAADPGARPSDWIAVSEAEQRGADALAALAKAGVTGFTVHLPQDEDGSVAKIGGSQR